MSNVPMTRPEEMLAVHETTFFHSSTFVELESGRVLHVSGTRFTSSDDGGITWSGESERRDANGNPVGGGDTSLVRLSGKAIGLAATRRDVPPPQTEHPWKPTQLLFWRSDDDGETWSAPTRVAPPGIGTYQDVMLRTSSGRIVIPVEYGVGQPKSLNDAKGPVSGKLLNGQWVGTAAHFFDPSFAAVYACYSDDEGQTWQRNEDGDLFILLDWNATYSFVVEPSVTEVYPGRLLMMMRTGLGRLYQAWSDDNGETWTRPQPTALASSTAPAQIRSIPSTGHLLVVWNQENEEEVKRGFNRTRMSSAISRNGGGVWEFFQNVESIHESTRVEPGPIRPLRPAEIHFEPGVPAPGREAEHILPTSFHGRWSYPSVYVMKDRVLIAHTYSEIEEHPTKAEVSSSSRKEGGFNQKLKVMPLTWFYGGKEPADNPFLPRAHDPASP